jgi:hypothetical protein
MVRRTRKSKKGSNGKYNKNGKSFKMLVGSRTQVMNGTAYKTTYGAIKPRGDALTKAHLKYNKHGRIVSKAKSSKKGKLLAQLRRAGYTTKKGKFGAIKINGRRTKKRRRTLRKKRRCRHKTGKLKGKYKKC